MKLLKLRAHLDKAREHLNAGRVYLAGDELNAALVLVAEKMHLMNQYTLKSRRKKGSPPRNLRDPMKKSPNS